MTILRINKYIADMGICSRRKADELVECGAVRINNLTAKHGDQVDPESDVIRVKGKNINKNEISYEYWALYKPIGVVSTAYDEKGRASVTDLVKSKSRIYPIGRLDADSEGLIILTNDGKFTNELIHPSKAHIKTYQITASFIKKNSLNWIKQQLEHGIIIDGKTMTVHKVTEIHKIDAKKISLNLELITGYNRQIRKMCGKIGLSVDKLLRIGIGNLDIYNLNLKPGEFKPIKVEDIL